MKLLLLTQLISSQRNTVNNLITWIMNRNDDLSDLLLMSNYNKNKHVRIEGYEEWWLQHYIEYDFFQLFRMSRATFHLLLEIINCPEMNKPFTGGEQPISGEKKLLMTLWWLGKGEVLLSVSDKFNVSVSVVHKSLETVLLRIINLRKRYIVWPDRHEMETIELNFRELRGYPGVIGAIDVCNVPIKPPAAQQDSYIDRKLRHSIKLQGICLSSKIFTNIMVGYPGSVHDSRVFHNCGLFMDIEQNNAQRKYFPLPEYHLLGDSAYPLLNWLLTPYRDNGHMRQHEIRHNTVHSSTRMVIENCFGLLKSRWRILNYINVNCVQKAVQIIVACCVLHNFCYINNDVWSNYENDDNGGDNHYEERLGHHLQEAEFKRNEIAQLF